MSTLYGFVDKNNLTAAERQFIADSVLGRYTNDWLRTMVREARSLEEAERILRHHVNGGTYCPKWEWTEVKGVINAAFPGSGHTGRITFREIASAARAGAMQLGLFEEASA